ncbi:ABC transporter ATP-binding protein [Arthrobacter sp. 35W]|uniref:ABC transporter ATP-binding protein n=1 Tax=Arthrobacter sp. 35W TaxID=1132441 RepID=UPI000420D039|nr:ABC transporter ATP-binding protein [Arthrobacter sp. 35W]
MSTTAAGAPDAPGSGLVASGISRRFGEVRAIEHMDFTAPAGAVTALIGPNGAGKTTLLLILASLLAPDTGTVRIMGIDPAEHPTAARMRVGWMPDTLGVWESLTAREILRIMGRLYRMPAAALESRVSDLLALVNLEGLANQPSRVLSRGQQQRLSLARALIHDPAVLLLDEPASGLDPGSRIQLRRILRELAAEGKAVVVSSHVLAELDEIADAAVFVNQGRSVLAQTIHAAAAQGRRYAISALDPAALSAALSFRGLQFRVEPGRRSAVSLLLGSEDDAARLLKDLVAADIAITSFAPAGGALEETYLSMDAEQR